MRLEFRQVDWPFAAIFKIAYRTQTVAETVWVELRAGGLTGRGEGLCVSYHGETLDSLLAQLTELKSRLRGELSRESLQELLPPGGARNAVDCALWDLEAKRAGRRAWELAGIDSVQPLTTAYTLGLDTLEATALAAGAARQYSLLKLKLSGDHDVERVEAVRKARPDVDIVVDANQSWSEAQLREWAPEMARLGVKLIEQPLPAGADEGLAGFKSPVPLCADESCQTTDSLSALVGRYEYVNIKLDKTGGLTEALRLAHSARSQGFKLMVGCMAGSSLSMAPGYVVGQLCQVIDLDGPLLASTDVPDAIRYEGSRMFAPAPQLWG